MWHSQFYQDKGKLILLKELLAGKSCVVRPFEKYFKYYTLFCKQYYILGQIVADVYRGYTTLIERVRYVQKDLEEVRHEHLLFVQFTLVL